MKLSFRFFLKKAHLNYYKCEMAILFLKKMGCNYSNYPPHFHCPSVPHFLSLKYGTRWPRKFDSLCRNIKYINLSHSGFSCFKAIFWRPSEHFWLTKKHAWKIKWSQPNGYLDELKLEPQQLFGTKPLFSSNNYKTSHSRNETKNLIFCFIKIILTNPKFRERSLFRSVLPPGCQN